MSSRKNRISTQKERDTFFARARARSRSRSSSRSSSGYSDVDIGDLIEAGEFDLDDKEILDEIEAKMQRDAAAAAGPSSAAAAGPSSASDPLEFTLDELDKEARRAERAEQRAQAKAAEAAEAAAKAAAKEAAKEKGRTSRTSRRVQEYDEAAKKTGQVPHPELRAFLPQGLKEGIKTEGGNLYKTRRTRRTRRARRARRTRK